MTIPNYVLLALLLSANFLVFSHTRRIQELQRKIGLVLTHLGIDPTAQVAPSSHVLSLAADPKQRIKAIKAYREQSGAGLKEAVAVIDKVVAGANGASP
jgi:ribosomal protein L7/L12